MNRFGSVPWPWIGVLVLVAVLAHELVLRIATGQNDPLLVGWRILMMTIGVASLGLLIMPDWRRSYLLGALVCAGLMGYALYVQYVIGLEPCPLCVMQRIAVIACGVVFVVGAIHNPGRLGAIVYSLVIILFAGTGAAIAARHVWLQTLPPDQVPACGPGLSYMLETLPLTDVLTRVFKGSGECAEVGWEFLGLAIPAWTLVFFIAMMVAAIVLVRRD